MSSNDHAKIETAAARSVRKQADSARGPARQRSSFLRDVRIDHGPGELLARVFIACDAALSTHGVTLSFATFDELREANDINRESWRPLNPTFHPANGNVNDDCAFAMLGRDTNGTVVTAQAMRVFDWQDTNFKLEAESGRLLFAKPAPMKRTETFCKISAPSASLITGRVGYAGAAWFHPSLRGRHLGALTARIGRAYGCTRWNLSMAFAVTSVALLAKEFIQDTGYTHAETGVNFVDPATGPPEAALVWLERHEIIADFEAFLESYSSKKSPVMTLRNSK
jgi:hypothetical protein